MLSIHFIQTVKFGPRGERVPSAYFRHPQRAKHSKCIKETLLSGIL